MNFMSGCKKETILLLGFFLFTKILFAQLTLPYTFENNSRYSNDEIYIGLVGRINLTGGDNDDDDVWMDMTNNQINVMSADDNTIPGPEWSTPADWLYPDIFTKLSDIENNTIQIPQGLYGCRIFISFESPMYLRFHATGGYAGANLSADTDPNDGIRWEIVELTWGDSGLWTNTSRVDAYQYPMGLEVNGFFGGIDPNLTYEEQYNAGISGAGTPQFKRIGEVLSHQEILDAWDTTVSAPYLAAKVVKEHSLDGEPIIEQPSKVDEFPKDILDDYIDDIWETYKNNDLVLNIGDRGIWTGRVTEDDIFVFTNPDNLFPATIFGKPSTVDALEGAGFLARSFSLAPAAQTNDLMIQAQISAAITRHAIYTDIIDGSIQYNHDADRFFQIEPYNEYVKFFHSEAISFESQTYAFAYDDVGDHSSTIQSTFPTDVKVIIGGYAEENAQAQFTSIIITPEESTILLNEELQLTAQGLDEFGELYPTNILWSADGGSIAENGVLSATENGTYTITATSGIISGTATIQVVDNELVLTSIEITPGDTTIYVNQQLQLTAQGLDQFNNPIEADIAWETISTGDTINEDGVFSSTEEGVFYIEAVSGDIKSGIRTIFVEFNPFELSSIQITPEESTILTNETLQLSAQVFDESGVPNQAEIIWTANGGDITEDGIFSAIENGTYTITATSGNISETATITVNGLSDPAELTSIEITPDESTILINEELQLTAQGYDQFGAIFETDIIWAATGGNITQNGIFSSDETGTFAITAISGEIRETATIIVNDVSVPDELTSIIITPDESAILINEELQLTAQGYDQFGAIFETNITWSTTGGNITQNGIFSSNETGTFTITAISEDIAETATVIVRDIPSELTTIEITPRENSIFINEELQLTAQGYDQFGNPLNVEITWSSDATISENGLFTSSESGTFTITATHENIVEEISIEVTTPDIPITIDCSEDWNVEDFSFILNKETNNTSITCYVNSGVEVNNLTIHYNINDASTFIDEAINIETPIIIEANENDAVSFYFTYDVLEENETSTQYNFEVGNCTKNVTLTNDGNDDEIEIFQLSENITIYPNPSVSGEEIYLTGLSGNSNIEIYDLLGRLVRSDNTSGVNSINIVAGELQPGFYIVTVSIRSLEGFISKNLKLIVN